MIDDKNLFPLELWLKRKANDINNFPSNNNGYFNRYVIIKNYLKDNLYPWIGAATSSEDQGIYTDHSEEHFNAVIKYAGQLLNIDNQEIELNPYEVFVMLVSILFHDAGNIYGRKGHEQRPFNIFTELGKAACPDQFEAKTIANIAKAHGGKVTDSNGVITKDTIGSSRLKEEDTYGGILLRPQLIAAVVRFADEICEDRSRAARFLLGTDSLPKKSEAYHHYANSISSVNVDLQSKFIHLKYEVWKPNVLRKLGKNKENVYLIDEINKRLEKMFCELTYCRTYMNEVVSINKIRATIEIIDQLSYKTVVTQTFELKMEGYPSNTCPLTNNHPDWTGKKLKHKLTKKKEGK